MMKALASVSAAAVLLVFGLVPDLRGAIGKAATSIVKQLSSESGSAISHIPRRPPPDWITPDEAIAAAAFPDFSRLASELAEGADSAARQGCARLVYGSTGAPGEDNDAWQHLSTLASSRSARAVNAALKVLDKQIRAQIDARPGKQPTGRERAALATLASVEAHGDYGLCTTLAAAISKL